MSFRNHNISAVIPIGGKGSRLKDVTGKVPKPLTVRAEVYKVNPYKVIYVGSKEFNKKGDEYTFVRFTVKKDGKVDDNLGFLKKKLVGNLPLHESFQ